MSEATTQREKLLEINHLKKYFHVKNGLLHAVDDVSFYIEKGRDAWSGGRIRLR